MPFSSLQDAATSTVCDGEGLSRLGACAPGRRVVTVALGRSRQRWPGGRSHNPWREVGRKSGVREIRTLRLRWRGQETDRW